ncbi:MAG: hypothetical protein OSA43_09430 [Pirellulales bacterium]|nr:hypothetical protein [Pirellulales bacterium]
MWLYHLLLVAGICLLGGCREEPRVENFGEVIYQIPVLPEEDLSTNASDQK